MAVTRSVLPWPRRPASLTFPTQFAATCSSDLFGRLYYAKTRFASVGKGPDTSVVIPVAIIGTCRGMTLGAHPGRSAAAFQARLSYKRGEMHGPERTLELQASPQCGFPKAAVGDRDKWLLFNGKNHCSEVISVACLSSAQRDQRGDKETAARSVFATI
jgi:hypothetical protein